MMRKCFVVVLIFAFTLTLPTLTEAQTAMTHDLVIGATVGGMVPLGENIKDRFNIGIPFTAHAKVPYLAEISGMSVGAGLEIGYYMASAEYGEDLSGIPISIFGDLDLSNLIGLPPVMNLGFELGLGLHLQDLGDSYTYFGLTPGIVFGYEVMEGLDIVAKLRFSEIVSSDDPFGGTQEWLDFRVGVSYTLPDLLPF
jgi:hypothetical protein